MWLLIGMLILISGLDEYRLYRKGDKRGMFAYALLLVGTVVVSVGYYMGDMI